MCHGKAPEHGDAVTARILIVIVCSQVLFSFEFEGEVGHHRMWRVDQLYVDFPFFWRLIKYISVSLLRSSDNFGVVRLWGFLVRDFTCKWERGEWLNGGLILLRSQSITIQKRTALKKGYKDENN